MGQIERNAQGALMELGNQIKSHRAALSLSQEELAEKVYVTRQTVSNWETGKSYPDIHSLLLLLSLIHISEPTRPPVASRMPSSA